MKLTKVIKTDNYKENLQREIAFEILFKEFKQFPIKKLLFLEYESPIPICLKNHYDCYKLQPGRNEKTGTWEGIISEVILTKHNSISCYIKKDNVPIIYRNIMTKKFNFKSMYDELYQKIKKEVQEEMKRLLLDFLDIVNEIMILDNKLYVSNLLTLGGINMNNVRINESRNKI